MSRISDEEFEKWRGIFGDDCPVCMSGSLLDVLGDDDGDQIAAKLNLLARSPATTDILAKLVEWWDRSSAEDGDEYMEALGWNEVGKLAQQARELLKDG